MAKSHVLACWDLCSKSHWADIKVSALIAFSFKAHPSLPVLLVIGRFHFLTIKFPFSSWMLTRDHTQSERPPLVYCHAAFSIGRSKYGFCFFKVSQKKSLLIQTFLPHLKADVIKSVCTRIIFLLSNSKPLIRNLNYIFKIHHIM